MKEKINLLYAQIINVIERDMNIHITTIDIENNSIEVWSELIVNEILEFISKEITTTTSQKKRS